MRSKAKLAMVIASVSMLLGASVVLGAEPRTGGYQGQTSQSELVRFRVSGGGAMVTRFRINLMVTCDGVGRVVVPLRTPAGHVSSRGRFGWSGADGSVSVRAVGRFVTQQRAVGTARLRLNDPEIGHCDSGLVHWRARSR